MNKFVVAKELLRSHWEKAKRTLSRLPSASIKTYLPEIDVDLCLEVKREDFEVACAHLFQFIVSEMKKVVSQAQVNLQ